jgi:hypothetical protein
MIFSDPTKTQVTSDLFLNSKAKETPLEPTSATKLRRQADIKKEKLTFEFIIGDAAKPEYKLEVQIRKERKMEEETLKTPNMEGNPPEKFLDIETKVHETEVKEEANPMESELEVKSEEKDDDFDSQLFENEITIEIPKDNFFTADEPSQNSTLSTRKRKEKKQKPTRNLEHLAQLVNEWYFTSSAQVIKELQKIYFNACRNKVIILSNCITE